MTATQDTAAREATSISSQANNSLTHPIINSPYEQPSRYWKLDHEHRATSEQVAGRRPSANLPAVPTQRLGEQLPLIKNQLVNDIREAVGRWRADRYAGATANTRWLLAHWTNPLAMRRLFFAQVEALETLIWLTEVAPGSGGRPKSDLLVSRRARQSRGFNDGLAPDGRQDGHRHRQDRHDGDGDRLARGQRREQPAQRPARRPLPHPVPGHPPGPDGARAIACARPGRSK